jgi:hypothetical protein
VIDAEEDPRVVGARRHVPQHGELAGGWLREAGLPEARDPNRPEAGILQLLERRARVPDRIVDGADEEGLVVAAAASEDQRGERERTAKGTLVRTTTGPGRVACT